tara:strand:+ start:116 stop:448 length:333 start_codon:yes stop_codon:yes gene_type:complete
MKLVALLGDMSDHGNGSINAAGVVASVLVNGKAIAVAGLGQGSAGDSLCDPNVTPNHCAFPVGVPGPGAGEGLLNVLAGGIPVHRVGDSRVCGGTTLLAPSLYPRTVTVN